MADWIHLDKTSGTGPAEVRVTADINETGEIRQATYKVIKEGTKEEKTFVCRQESVPVVIIPEFDFLVLRYIWDDEDGIDFDTATGFDNTGLPDVDGKLVGWSKQNQTTQERVGDYLIHGGDNMESGNEAALIQMGPLLDGDNYDKLPAYSEFFSKVNLSDEAIKKIYTWIFTNFFPDFAFIPINLGDKMNPKTLMSTTGNFNDSHTEVINLHIDVNHTSAGMLTQLDNGLTIADNLYCILSVFDHETMHLLGWMENPLAYYYLGEVAQEYAAYRYQIFDSIYWGFAPPSFHIMIIGSYLKYNKKHSLKL